MSICKPRGVVPSRDEWARMHAMRERHQEFAIIIGRENKRRYIELRPHPHDDRAHMYAVILSGNLRKGNAVLYCGYYRAETVTYEEEDFSPDKRLRVWSAFYDEHPDIMKALSRARERAESLDSTLTRVAKSDSGRLKIVHLTTLNSYWDAAGIILQKAMAFSNAAVKAGVCPDRRTISDEQERMRVCSIATWADDYQTIVPSAYRRRDIQVSKFMAGRSVPRREQSIAGPMKPRDRYEAATYYKEPQPENPYRRRCPNHGFQRTDHSNRIMSWMGAIY